MTIIFIIALAIVLNIQISSSLRTHKGTVLPASELTANIFFNTKPLATTATDGSSASSSLINVIKQLHRTRRLLTDDTDNKTDRFLPVEVEPKQKRRIESSASDDNTTPAIATNDDTNDFKVLLIDGEARRTTRPPTTTTTTTIDPMVTNVSSEIIVVNNTVADNGNGTATTRANSDVASIERGLARDGSGTGGGADVMQTAIPSIGGNISTNNTTSVGDDVTSKNATAEQSNNDTIGNTAKIAVDNGAVESTTTRVTGGGENIVEQVNNNNINGGEIKRREIIATAALDVTVPSSEASITANHRITTIPPSFLPTFVPYTFSCDNEIDELGDRCQPWVSSGYCNRHLATKFLYCRKSCLCTGPTIGKQLFDTTTFRPQ